MEHDDSDTVSVRRINKVLSSRMKNCPSSSLRVSDMSDEDPQEYDPSKRNLIYEHESFK